MKRERESAPARMRRAAAELLIRQGPGAITHRQVAEAAGVPQGSANYFFPTKLALYAAAVRAAEELRLASAQDMLSELSVCKRSVEEVATLLIRAWYAPSVGADVVRARLEPMVQAMHDPELGEVMRVTRPQLLAVLAQIVVRSGYQELGDIELVAIVLDGALLYGEQARGVVADVESAAATVASEITEVTEVAEVAEVPEGAEGAENAGGVVVEAERVVARLLKLLLKEL